MIYIDEKVFFYIYKVYLDSSEVDLSDATIRIQNFHLSRKLWWKIWWNYYVAEKRIVFELSKISNPNFDRTNLRLECRLCQNFKVLSFIVSEKYDVKERDGRPGCVGSWWKSILRSKRRKMFFTKLVQDHFKGF